MQQSNPRRFVNPSKVRLKNTFPRPLAPCSSGGSKSASTPFINPQSELRIPQSEITGTRPGEKLYEELFDDHEASVPMPHPKLHAARYQRHAIEEVESHIGQLVGSTANTDEALREMLQAFVSTYTFSRASGSGESGERHVMQDCDDRSLAHQPGA